MRSVALIYNPTSGQRHSRRATVIAEIAAVFEDAGIAVQLIPTTASGSAGRLAWQAAADGCDTVLACGGDGTAHEALQGMVGETVALGVIPLGTANALAADLGLPRNPVKAARMLLDADPVRIPVGKISFRDSEGAPQSRFFVVAAGAGVDALFFARLNRRMKHRFGYAAYLAAALKLWATHNFPKFRATFSGGVPRVSREEDVSQLLAVRIGNFGGLVRNLVPGAGLLNETLHVIAFKTSSRLRYLRFMSAVWFARHTYSDAIERLECSTIDCADFAATGIPSMVEADGELLGFLPASIELMPRALTLLIPRRPR
jgi:YegS/Rv2252/BmrU family lipid kinase